MEPLKAAVSGLRHGKDHCDAYRNDPDFRLAGLFDPNPARVRERLAENPGAAAYDSFEAMLKQAKPDLVSISSPEFAHVDQAVAALEAGCHVLLEKAMADTMEGLERIVAAVERTGRLLYVGQEGRLTPAFLDARRLHRDGKFGRVYQAESCYVHNCEFLCVGGQWRGDPKLANHLMIGGGCHPVDLLRSLLGEVDEVYARDTHFNPEVTPYPDCISTLLHFESGAVGTVVVSAATRRPYWLRLAMNGTRGYFAGDNSGGASQICFAPPLKHAEKFDELPTYHSSHDCASQVKNLAAAIREGAPLLVDAWEGANAAAICMAAVESARTHRPIIPRRFVRPKGIQPPAEALDVMNWRKLDDIGNL